MSISFIELFMQILLFLTTTFGGLRVKSISVTTTDNCVIEIEASGTVGAIC